MNGFAASSIYVENERPATWVHESTKGCGSTQRYGESGGTSSTCRTPTLRKGPPAKRTQPPSYGSMNDSLVVLSILRVRKWLFGRVDAGGVSRPRTERLCRKQSPPVPFRARPAV